MGESTKKNRPDEQAHEQLETIIDELADSYDAGRSIDNLESAALPSQRKIAEALGHLKHIVYMGFYSTRRLSSVNLRQHIGQHVHDAYEILVEQISRAVVYRRLGGGEPASEDLRWSERVVLEAFGRFAQVRAAVALDVEAAYEGDPAARSVEEIIFSYPAIEAITVYRVAHIFYERDVPLIPRIMAELAHSETGIDIHPGATIGERFFIDHGTGVVVGETTIIGDNVKIYQGVTLGALSIPRDQAGSVIREGKRHPTIEDDVTIYAGAKILGGNTVVGAGSVVGGNVWLTQSVPAGTRVTYDPPTGCGQTTQTVARMPTRSKTG